MLPRGQRLTRSADYRRVYKEGRSARGRVAVVYYLSTEQPGKQIGISVSRKIGSAVVRNRVKRRLREAVRRYLEELPEGARVVVVARNAAREVPYEGIVLEIGRLLEQIGARKPAGERPCLPTGGLGHDT